MLNYLSWAMSATGGGLSRLWDADVVLVYSSPATAAIPAMVAKVLFGRPYVLMIQDLWPDSIFASGFLNDSVASTLVRMLVGSFAKLSYRLSSSICVIAPGMRDELVKRGVDPSKVKLIYNWVDESCFRPAEPDPEFRSSLGIGPNDFVLMYAGNHGAAQDLGNVLDAMALIQSDRPIHLVLIGEGVEKESLVERVSDEHSSRVHFLPPRAANEMAPIMASADFQLVSLSDSPLFHITMPSKIQSILATGSPILVCAPGDAARVAMEACAGIACPPGDPEALASTIAFAAQLSEDQKGEMRTHGLAYYRAKMAESIGVLELSSLLEKAVRAECPTGKIND